MDEKVRFIADSRTEFFSFSELCRRYGVSRKTGYKWLGRYEDEGPPGLEERSRRPHSCPHATDAEIIDALMEMRRKHPRWGAKKLLKVAATSAGGVGAAGPLDVLRSSEAARPGGASTSAAAPWPRGSSDECAE